MATMHTPGPWVYSLHSDFAEISQPGGLTVCSMALRLLDINTSMADARLIAAAPDLLAALKVMVGRSIPYTPHWKDDPEIVAAHTAIAKAEAR